MTGKDELQGEGGRGSGKRPNRLIHELSPYLLQHAWNPVEWFPWGEEAFSRAETEGKPVFLSIGYATCHWCHVMERESFEDPEVARVLNEGYVSIKVDREERPDLDSLYMNAGIEISGQGGWPLNLILTPDRKPFFAMTYIPRERRFGSPGIIDILSVIGRMWREDRASLLESAERVAKSLSSAPRGRRGRIPRDTIERGFQELRLSFDRTNGGFGNAPKFPLPHNLLFLLRYWQIKGDAEALAMVEKSLHSMAMGGIYDQVGSGFHRYSTDPRWIVPHFEKMLYDQALLVLAYTEAYQATGDEWFGRIGKECLDFVLRELRDPGGGFRSALDAESGGEEGGFYLWTKKEVEDILDDTAAAAVIRAWHLTTAGNYLDPLTGERTGKNIPRLTRKPEELASVTGLLPAELGTILTDARGILLEERERRIRPLTDDKVLADWNGLMIAACARGARVYGDHRYLEAAREAGRFVLGSMRGSDGRLLHRYREGSAGIRGLAADYAFVIFGLTELYMATFDPSFLSSAVELQGHLDREFWDEARGGYFNASREQGDLIAWQKDLSDGAIPSANSVAFTNLLRLTMLTGEIACEKRASALSQVYADLLRQSPASCTFLLSGLCLLFGPSTEVVIVEGGDSGHSGGMTGALNARYLPFMVVLLKNAMNAAILAEVAPFTKDMGLPRGETAAFVCSRHACSLPVAGIESLLESVSRRPGQG